MKYLENKQIVENVFDIHNKSHYNWIATISFYTVLHIVEMQLAYDNIHCGSHITRENMLKQSQRISDKTLAKFKHMYSMSRLARYEAKSISPTIACSMLKCMHDIEKEYNLLK